MDKEKLVEIGEKLDVSEEDITTVNRQYRLAKIISLITGTITVFLSYAIGSYRGNAMGVKAAKEISNNYKESYPYAQPGLFLFGAAIIGSEYYSGAIEYGVYYK